MRGRDDSGHNLVSNVVVVNLNVLCMLMKIRIYNNEYSDLIIIIYGS